MWTVLLKYFKNEVIMISFHLQNPKIAEILPSSAIFVTCVSNSFASNDTSKGEFLE